MKTALVWLRNDLRFQDQNSFYKSCNDFDRVVANFAFEPKDYEKTAWGFQKTGKFRIQFLLETLKSLDIELKQNNISLIVENRSAVTGIPIWIEELQASSLFYQEEWTKEERPVSCNVCSRLSENIEINSDF